MNCELCQNQISRLMDGELPIEESAEMFDHLGKCETCRKFYYQLRSLNLSLGQLRQANVPLPTGREVHTATKKSNQFDRFWSKQIPVRFPVLTLLVFALAIGVFFSIQMGFKPRERETVYLTKLPEVVVTANSADRTDHH